MTGQGAVATALVQKGTLKPGDVVVAGAQWGRVKLLLDERFMEALRRSVMAMRQRAVRLCFSRLREAGRGRVMAVAAAAALTSLARLSEGRALRQWRAVAEARAAASLAALQVVRRWEGISVAWGLVQWSAWARSVGRLRQVGHAWHQREAAMAPFAPDRSLAAWYMWRCADTPSFLE